MKRPILFVPPAAMLLGAVMIGGGFFLGGAPGSWLLPIVVTVVEKGWFGIREIPAEMYVFPKDPLWIDTQSTLFVVVTYGKAVLGTVTAVAGAFLATKLWRYLVVKKLRWMTDREVDEYLHRASET